MLLLYIPLLFTCFEAYVTISVHVGGGCGGGCGGGGGGRRLEEIDVECTPCVRGRVFEADLSLLGRVCDGRTSHLSSLRARVLIVC